MNHRDSFTDNFGRSTLVFVTDQFRCERLISAGYSLAEATRTSLIVMSVASTGAVRNAAAVEQLYQVTRDHDAVMNVVYADDDIAGIMSRAIIQHKACHVITGLPKDETSVIVKLWRIHASVNFYTVSMDGQLNAVPYESRCPAQD